MKKKVVVITGPTGVGKTKISIEIAKLLNTEIINGDAYQIYTKMDIGTAKPTTLERSEVKHNFFDFLDPINNFSVSDYQREIRSYIDDFSNKNIVPLIVGGTGLYIDSVIMNYQFLAPKRENDNKFDDLSNKELHKVLEKIDYDASIKIHMNNRKRVLRAIKLANTQEIESRTLKNEFYYDALVIFLNAERDVLYDRINKRVDKMINEGLVDEVKSLYPNQLGLTAKAAIGYKELFLYLNNEISLEDAIAKIKQNSRHYAKRQMTWYRNKPYANFINVDFNNIEFTINEVYNLIKTFLNN